MTLPAAATYTEVHDLTPAAPKLDQAFVLDGASTVTLTFIAQSSTLKINIVDPAGTSHSFGATDSVVTASGSFDFSGSGAGPWNYLFTLSNPPAGNWRYQVSDTTTVTSPHAVVFMVVTSSSVSVLLLGGGQDYPLSRNIGIGLLVTDGSAPVKGSSITSLNGVVRGSAGESVPIVFADDGKGLDDTANDGIYTATFQVTQADTYTLSATVAGSTGNGPFTRNASVVFRGVAPCGVVSPTVQTATFDLNGNGRPDGLNVMFTVTPKAAGNFRLLGTLTAGNGMSVSETAAFSIAGTSATQETVRFTTADLMSLGTNGPYQVSNGRLECIQSDGTSQTGDTQVGLGSTLAVDLTGLERPAVILTGQISDKGVDTNSNGLFDRLDVTVGVNALTSGSYQWSASLIAANSVPVGSTTGSGTLPAGASTITVSFTGTAIGQSGIDGPYTVRILAISGNGQSVMPGTAGQTSSYRFDQFEGAPARLAASAVVNGASFISGGAAPGQVITIFGKNLGPTTGVTLQFAPGSSSMIATTLSSVMVTFNGIPAPLFFVRADQINCQVPIEISGASSATVTVYYQGQVVAGTSVPVIAVNPSIFTTGGGKGTAAMLNQDGSIHSLTNPAAPGSVIQIYMTGQGVVTPPLLNGQLVPPVAPFPASPLPVTATVGGLPAKVIFAGMAPNLVGLFQVNVMLPAATAGGSAVPLSVSIGTAASQPGVTIAVSGSGGPITGPALSLSTNALAFGSVTVGQTKDQSLTVSNAGNAALTVSSSSVSGTGFSLTTAASFTVQPGGSQTMTVRYAPGSAASVIGTLTITSNDPGSPATVTLSGTGTSGTGVPKLTLSTNALSFGSVGVGQSKDLSVTATNSGTATLSASSVAVSGAGFSLGSSTSFSIAPGANQPITVHYAPTSTGASSGSLTIASNDSGSPATIGLSGTGTGPSVAPAIGVNPASLSFGNVTVGQTSTLTLAVNNTGTATLNLSALTVNAPFSVVSPAAPATVNAGASATVTVKFAPAAAGLASATLSIASNDPSKPTLNVSLTGTGVAATGTITLQVDQGPPYDMVFGYAQGQNGAVFVNRLTPPSYPATLESIQIYFGNRSNGLAAGTPINLVWGTSSLVGAAIQISQTGAFNSYTLGTPLTITSGDFYVGFQVNNPPGIYPADYETTSGSQQRSYFGTSTLALIDSVGAPGNFGIRAVVKLGQ